MNDVPDTELFGAYLDGELTAAEQVRVEQMLATSPDARQVLEELRALGSTLRACRRRSWMKTSAPACWKSPSGGCCCPTAVDDAGEKPSAGRAGEALKDARCEGHRLAGNSLARDLLAGDVQQAGLDLVGHYRSHRNRHPIHLSAETKRERRQARRESRRGGGECARIPGVASDARDTSSTTDRTMGASPPAAATTGQRCVGKAGTPQGIRPYRPGGRTEVNGDLAAETIRPKSKIAEEESLALRRADHDDLADKATSEASGKASSKDAALLPSVDETGHEIAGQIPVGRREVGRPENARQSSQGSTRQGRRRLGRRRRAGLQGRRIGNEEAGAANRGDC